MHESIDVPLHLLLSVAKSSRPRRGRPPKTSASMTCTKQTLTLRDTGCDVIVKGTVRRKGVRLKNVKRSDGTVNDGDNVDTLKSTVSIKEYQSAIARCLSLNSEFAKVYCDGCFSVVSRTRSRRHLEV